MNKETANKAYDLANRISKENEVLAVVLFGSQAKGKAHKESDIDIAVVSNSKVTFEGYSNSMFEVSSFFKLPLNIQFRIIKEGKMLLCKDSSKLSSLYSDILKKYLDYSSMMRRYYKKVIYNV